MSESDFAFYKTSDIYFSAYLCALDVPLHTTESEQSNNAMNKKIIFIFKKYLLKILIYKSKNN